MKILITPYVREENKYLQLAQYYTNAITQRGAIPIIVPITDDTAVLDAYLKEADGVLISGGVDVDPAFYGEVKKETCKFTHRLQDDTGLYLLKYAIENKLPVFGICRGLQLINVFFGGTLYQDINTEIPEVLEHNPDTEDSVLSHDVRVERNSLLHRITEVETLSVNTVHHQAIKVLGKGLIVNAKSTDGIIEAVEGPNGLIAVQWHPEVLQASHIHHAKIFDYFIKLVKNRASF